MSAWKDVNYEEFGKYIKDHFGNLMGLKKVSFDVEREDKLLINLYIDMTLFTIDVLIGKDKRYLMSKIKEEFIIDAGCHGIPLNMQAGRLDLQYRIRDFENNKTFSFVNGEIDFLNYIS